MTFHINHIHVRSRDPRASADWFVKAFNFAVQADIVRKAGDRFVRCQTENGALRVIFSSARDNETLQDGIDGPHYGLEHFGIDSTDVRADVERLVALGAKLEEGPAIGGSGRMVAFLTSPHGVLLELNQVEEK